MKKIPTSLAFAALLPIGASGAPSVGVKPNIIFVLTDDLGWGDLGVYWQNVRRASGAPAELTPNLDKMAAEGVRFTDHYSAAPVCAPSRASFLSGVHQGHSGLRNNQFDRALDDNHTLATVLRQAGYSTAVIGKWGLQGGGEGPMEMPGPDFPAHPLHRGFDFFYGYMRHIWGHEHYPKEALYYGKYAKAGSPIKVWENYTDVVAGLDKCYTADLWTARAKKYIVDQTRDSPKRPFFLYLAFDTPHAVLELPTQAYPEGGGLKGGLQWLGTRGHTINTATGRIDSFVYPEFANATDGHGQPWPDINKRYASSVRRIDDCVGDLLHLLKDLKIDDHTLVIFSSDNGPSIESYLPQRVTPQFFASYGPFDGIKRDCWEGGMREPAIARWPGTIPAGRVSGFPSGLWDWLPTFAEVAGLPPPARTDGVSLLPAMTGAGLQRDPGFLYFEYFEPGRTPNFPEFEPGHRNRLREQMQALRIGDFIGVRYDVKTAGDDFELYNVATDRKEAKNLAADPAYSALQRQMKEKAIQSRRPDPDAPRPYDDELMAPVALAQSRQGVNWKYYEGNFPWVPDLEALAAAASGSASHPDLSCRRRENEIAVLFSGYIDAPKDGDYTFYLSADTGAFLRIHDAAAIDADFNYKSGAELSGAVKLKAGLHPFHLYYARSGRASPFLSFAWKGPGIPKQIVPDSAYRRSSEP